MMSYTVYYVEVQSKVQQIQQRCTSKPSRKARKIVGYLLQAQYACCGVTQVHYVVYLGLYCVQDVIEWVEPHSKKHWKYPAPWLQFELFNPHIRLHSFHFLLACLLPPSLSHTRSFVLFLSVSSNGFCPTLQCGAETSQPLQA